MHEVDQDRATCYHEVAHAVFAVLVCGGIREGFPEYSGGLYVNAILYATLAPGRKKR